MKICRAIGISKFFALLCIAGFGQAQAQSAIPASERAVLDAIYRQTNGASWLVNTGWEGPVGTECSWNGVACSTAGDHVIVINLSSNNLTGTLPALTGLSGLEQFVVDHNGLRGTIPVLAGLSNLQNFNVGANKLTGSIPALTGLPSLQEFDAFINQLSGRIPALTRLTNLKVFNVGANQLTGNIPTLTGLSSLQLFVSAENQLTGSIPDLTGLSNLVGLYVYSNQLTGSIPALVGLRNLQVFDVVSNQLTGRIPNIADSNLRSFDIGSNGLSGDIPGAPGLLVAGASSLCNNPLNHTDNAAWDTATGVTPWYSTCTSVVSILTVTTTDTPVATGTDTTITVTVTTTAAKALNAAAAGDSTGAVTVADSNGNIVCYMGLINYTGSCDVILPSGNSNLTVGYSGNGSVAAASVGFSKTTPVTIPGNLDQHGWTGTWYNPATGGQGIVFEIYPDLSGPGSGLFGGGWFTYDTSAGGEDHKRWYTLTGPVTSSSPTTTLDIVATGGGNFNAGPVINSANGLNYVGHATLGFTDCMHGNLTYSFTDGSARVGTIPLSRLDTNVTCDPTNGNGNGTAPGTFLLSGSWFDPSTSGQGILFDINPLENVTFAAWYTYAPNGQSIGGGASQRWYTLQVGSAEVGTATLSNIGIFSSQGGVFNVPGGVTTPQVGTGSIVFQDCAHLTLGYSFTSGTNGGLSGSIHLVRTGPTPAGCSL